MTDCILSGGRADVDPSSQSNADPLVVLRVTLSTNVFWFVKHHLALFKVLSQVLSIPLNCSALEDGGFDVQVCRRIMMG